MILPMYFSSPARDEFVRGWAGTSINQKVAWRDRQNYLRDGQTERQQNAPPELPGCTGTLI
jgi:hypothetical protein